MFLFVSSFTSIFFLSQLCHLWKIRKVQQIYPLPLCVTGFLFSEMAARVNTQFHKKKETLLHWPCDLYSLFLTYYTEIKAAQKHFMATQRKAKVSYNKPAVALLAISRLQQYVWTQKGRKLSSLCFPLCIKSATSSGWPLRQCSEPEGKISKLSALHLFTLQWPSSHVTKPQLAFPSKTGWTVSLLLPQTKWWSELRFGNKGVCWVNALYSKLTF